MIYDRNSVLRNHEKLRIKVSLAPFTIVIVEKPYEVSFAPFTIVVVGKPYARQKRNFRESSAAIWVN